MYTLQLADGSSISNLSRINANTFTLQSTDASIYWKLSDSNLGFATLLNNDELEDVFMDYTLQNYSVSGGTIRFRIVPLQTIQEQEKHQKNKIQRKQKDWYMNLRIEKEMKI